MTFMPQQGGMPTSLKLLGKDILATKDLFTKDGKVRGGIPILFPNAGPINSPLYPGLKQHGFAREMRWMGEADGQSFTEELHSTDETLKQFPYKFILQVRGTLEEKKFTLLTTVTNAEVDKDMPLAMGLHPYFKVNKADRANIKFDFAGGEVFRDRKEEWMNGKAVSIDNPKKYSPSADMPIEIPGTGRIILDASDAYKKIVAWSEGDHICIEPWMGEPGALIDNPHHLGTKAPDNMISARFSIALDK